MFNKDNFPTKSFIAASMITFVLIGLLYSFVEVNYLQTEDLNYEQVCADAAQTDPFITIAK